MERVNTYEVQAAFNDLIKELQKVKDLTDISISYKETAANLADTLRVLMESTKDANEQNIARMKMTLEAYLTDAKAQFQQSGAFLVEHAEQFKHDVASLIDKNDTSVNVINESAKSTAESALSRTKDMIGALSENMSAKLHQIGQTIGSHSAQIQRAAGESTKSIIEFQKSFEQHCNNISDTLSRLNNSITEQSSNLAKINDKMKSHLVFSGMTCAFMLLISVLLFVLVL